MHDTIRRTFKTEGGETFDDVVREARAYLEATPCILLADVEITVVFPARGNRQEALPRPPSEPTSRKKRRGASGKGNAANRGQGRAPRLVHGAGPS